MLAKPLENNQDHREVVPFLLFTAKERNTLSVQLIYLPGKEKLPTIKSRGSGKINDVWVDSADGAYLHVFNGKESYNGFPFYERALTVFSFNETFCTFCFYIFYVMLIF